MRIRVVGAAVAAGVLALGLAGSGWAQSQKKPEDPVEKRFQGIEKQVRQLREIVLQARDTGQPVQVRVSNEPDPELDSLQQRLDDLEQAARTRNDQIDGIAHDLDLAKKNAANLETELKAVQDRIARLDAQVKAAAEAAVAAPPAASAGPGALPGPPPPPQTEAAPPAVSADQAFRRARQLLLEGQYPAASDAFQSFVETYGDTQRGPEARYWLGETLYIRGLYPDAAAAYIGAIRGWPQTTWAPDAVVKLARALVALNKPTDACRALDEFVRRYPDASPPAKTRAQAVRAAAKCKV